PTPDEEKSPLTVLDEAERAPKQADPAGGAMRTIKAVVTIEALDRPARTITVKGPMGRYFTARVHDPSILEQPRIGDTMVETITQAAAVSLTKSESKSKQ